jgi:hypothetical protein
MSGILVVKLTKVFAAHPQSDAFRLPGDDVNVDAHAVQGPPFAP